MAVTQNGTQEGREYAAMALGVATERARECNMRIEGFRCGGSLSESLHQPPLPSCTNDHLHHDFVYDLEAVGLIVAMSGYEGTRLAKVLKELKARHAATTTPLARVALAEAIDLMEMISE